MKKLISCALILAALGSLGTMCFALNGVDPAIMPTNFERITPDYNDEGKRQEYLDAYEYYHRYEEAAELCDSFVDSKDNLKQGFNDLRNCYKTWSDCGKTMRAEKEQAESSGMWEMYEDAKEKYIQAQKNHRVAWEKLDETLDCISDIYMDFVWLGCYHGSEPDNRKFKNDSTDPMFISRQFASTIMDTKKINDRMSNDGVNSDMRVLSDVRYLDDDKFNAFLKVTDDMFNDMKEYSETFIRKAEALSDKAYDFHFTEPFSDADRRNAPAIGDNVLTNILREEKREENGWCSWRLVPDLSIIYNLAELQGTLEYGQAQELLNCDLGALE